MSFPRYERHKDSGIQWMGEVPEHWGLYALRHNLDSIFNGISCDQVEPSQSTVPVTRIETISRGIIDYEKVGFIESTFAREDRKLLPGDILFSNINSLSMIGNCAIVQNEPDLYAGMNLLVLRPNGRVAPAFLYWLIRSPLFRCEVESLAKPAINQASISQSSLKNIDIPQPSLDEQIAIASFLDQETAKIDALIEEQRCLIALLKEKRQAVISQAVTKGLNAAAPMKDSGIPWLGAIPKHWELTRIKKLSKIISKGTTPTTVGAEFTTAGVRFLKAENITSAGVSDEPEFYISEESNKLLSRSALEVHDVLVVIAGATTGKSAIMPANLLPANTNQAVSFVRLTEAKHAEFVNLWLSSNVIQESILLNSVQSAQPNLSMEDLGNVVIAMPPPNEIVQITSDFAWESARWNELLLASENAIALLQERRSALISAAVTGKIDVRNYSPRETPSHEEVYEPA